MKINLKDDERKIIVLRAAKVTSSFALFIGAILIFLPVFLKIPFLMMGLPGKIFFWASIGIGIVWIFKKIFFWTRNKTVVTNKRVIDVYQKKFFDVVVSEVGFHQIEDISFRKKGIFGHLFDYGTVNLAMRTSKVSLEIRKVKKPALVQSLLNDLKNISLNSDTSTMEKMIEKFQSLGSVERKALLHSLSELNRDSNKIED